MINFSRSLLALCALRGVAAFIPPTALTRPSTSLHSNPPKEEPAAPLAPSPPEGPLASNLFSNHPSVFIQGSTLRTWDFSNPATQRVQISAQCSGRPIHARIEYWHTPSYIPMQFKMYSEDGALRPLNAVIETPKHPKSIACFNTAAQEFPLRACVAETGLGSAYDTLSKTGAGKLCQGGQITSYSFDSSVDSVQILLKTEERNMKARIELTQGPNNVKQSFDIYASVGYKTPFYAVIETPGAGNVVRIINENTVEFPFNAWVQPYKTGSGDDLQPIMIGGF